MCPHLLQRCAHISARRQLRLQTRAVRRGVWGAADAYANPISEATTPHHTRFPRQHSPAARIARDV